MEIIYKCIIVSDTYFSILHHISNGRFSWECKKACNGHIISTICANRYIIPIFLPDLCQDDPGALIVLCDQHVHPHPRHLIELCRLTAHVRAQAGNVPLQHPKDVRPGELDQVYGVVEG